MGVRALLLQIGDELVDTVLTEFPDLTPSERGVPGDVLDRDHVRGAGRVLWRNIVLGNVVVRRTGIEHVVMGALDGLRIEVLQPIHVLLVDLKARRRGVLGVLTQTAHADGPSGSVFVVGVLRLIVLVLCFGIAVVVLVPGSLISFCFLLSVLVVGGQILVGGCSGQPGRVHHTGGRLHFCEQNGGNGGVGGSGRLLPHHVF